MAIDRDEVRRIAELSGLPHEPGDESIADSLRTILDHVAMLEELDVSNVEPTRFGADCCPCDRADEPRSGLTREEALRNAPDVKDGQFRVPGFHEP